MAEIQESFESIHKRLDGKVSDKWSSYLGFYDSVFSALRNDPIRMLEIGVQNGGSLETWNKYFANAQVLIGCDINPKCGELKYESENIHVILGDATAEDTKAKIINICSEFDIVIDDGSHTSSDIIRAFLRYFPHLKPGGTYVIEDTHALYWSKWGGGILSEVGAYAFFKKLVDVINFQFWKNELSLDVYLRTFFPLGTLPELIAKGWVEGIEFRNSLITIKKSKTPGHEKLGERIVGGEVAVVDEAPKAVRGSKIII